MKELTMLERKFLNAYIENGGNATKAYQAAVPKERLEKLTKGSISVNGCNLLKSPKIIRAINDRMIELEKSSAIQFETKRLELWDMAKTWRESGDVRSGIAAVNEMNKMDGHHAAQSLHIRSEQFVFGQSMGLSSDPIEGELEPDDQ